eukprot:6185281-Pleurochrysis_carterae.AAC.3
MCSVICGIVSRENAGTVRGSTSSGNRHILNTYLPYWTSLILHWGAHAMAPSVREDTALWPHVLSGMAGRVCAETFVSPFNLVKVRLQHDLALKGQPLPIAFIQLSRSEGLLSLWRGLPPRLMWATPMAAATFTYYHAAKTVTNGSGPGVDSNAPDGGASKTEQQGTKEKRIVLLGPAILAAAVAVRTPFDIAEQRLQITHEGSAATEAVPAHVRAIRVLRGVWQKEGLRGLWRGYSAALCGNMSYVVGYFVRMSPLQHYAMPSDTLLSVGRLHVFVRALSRIRYPAYKP